MATYSGWFKKLIVTCLSIFFIFKSFGFQNDSLYYILKNSPHDTTRVKVLVALSQSHTLSKDKAYAHALEALQISKNINYKFGIGLSCYALIDFAKDRKELDHLATTALEIFDDLNDMHYKGQTLLSTGYIYVYNNAEYTTAHKYAQEFMLINQKLTPDPYMTARGWNLLGEIYRITKNYEKALEAYQNASHHALNINGEAYVSPFINVGTVYKDKGQYEKALNRYDSILNILKSENMIASSTYAYVENRKAQVHLLQGNFEEAFKEASKSLESYTKLNFTKGIILALTTLSEAQYNLNQHKESITNGIRAIELATTSLTASEGLDRVAKIVADGYSALNDYESAFLYQQVHNDIYTSIYAPESYIELANQQITLEVEKQELEKRLLEEQTRASALTIKNQRIINLIVISAFVLLSVLSFVLFKNIKTKTRLNFELKEKQDEILQQSEELKAQAEELQTYNEKIKIVNATLEDMVVERTNKIQQQNKRLTEYAFQNAHNVRGPLARILGLIYLMDRDLPDDSYSHYKLMLKEAGEELDQVISQIKQQLEGE